MQVTTGVDLIEVERIKDAIEEMGNSFLERIYTQKEIDYCEKSGKMKYQHYAARFAAKEAVFKSLSRYLNGREDTLWKDIEVLNNEDGRPEISVSKLNKEKLRNLQSIDISLSHIKEYAIASVVAVFEDKTEK